MFQLPENEHLPIHKLVACFNNTSATYKFYWLIAITEQVEMGRTMISKKELFAEIVLDFAISVAIIQAATAAIKSPTMS